MNFQPTVDEIKAYRTEHEVGLIEAESCLIKEKMIKHLQDGGSSEPVLLYLLENYSFCRK